MAEATAAKKTTKKVKLCFPHEAGFPGQVKTFFNIECTANKDGVYECTIDGARAKAELARKNVWKFMRPQDIEDIED